MRAKSFDANGVHRRRKLRWRRAKKNLADIDQKKDATPLHVLVEPADLNFVGGARRTRAGRGDVLT